VIGSSGSPHRYRSVSGARIQKRVVGNPIAHTKSICLSKRYGMIVVVVYFITREEEDYERVNHRSNSLFVSVGVTLRAIEC
jgi:hypothetical protein